MPVESKYFYEVIAESSNSTVVKEYEYEKKKSTSYQSEAQLEAELINMLKQQGYDYLDIHSEEDLISNLRIRLEELNDYKFSDNEWDTFFKQKIANQNYGIAEKTRIIQEDNVQLLKTDSGTTKNITLIDKDNIHNNSLQVINQYEVGKKDGANYDNRYDVTIMVNGLPLVHIELKRRGVAIQEAFNQIKRYQRDSFWTGCGLYDYIQIFVISNGTNTKYYSNTTRDNWIKEQEHSKNKSKNSNSFEFTTFWADAKNNIIVDLVDFTKTFFAKHTILNILTKYCVYNVDKQLMVMRPYQITATERIINYIDVTNNYKKYGSIEGGGFVWHSTGSGKTLTSYKTARLASQLDYIDKVLFVVDRKDLDYQTMREYNHFEEGCADGNTSTSVLTKQLGDPNSKIIITTIQKLNIFIKKHKQHEIYDKHVVMIFDECHRGQFGKNHNEITRAFKKYHIFGFTGTPIFSDNAMVGKEKKLMTTLEVFGVRLHEYTIIDAIKDENVLPFKVDYISTMKEQEYVKDEQVYDINREKALLAPQRVTNVVNYIVDKFDRKTKRDASSFDFNTILNVAEVVKSYKDNEVKEIKESRRTKGFNAIFATASIPAAKAYYTEFKKKFESEPGRALKIATIYSYGVNEDEDVPNGILGDENSDSAEALKKPDRDFLESAIKDYNKMFKTNYSTSGEEFQNYYKDVSLRMKNKELDLLIVVNMFLTGFDATTLNTLFVDKNLRYHGLIQAFSRTNRILNSVKKYGNIVCFRNLEDNVNKAVSLYSDRNSNGIVIIRKFDDYYNGYTDDKGKDHLGYKDIVSKLQDKFSLEQPEFVGEKVQKEFISLFGSFLRMTNLLSSFDDFEGKEILTKREIQDYTSRYQDLYDKYNPKGPDGETVDIVDDVIFEMELIKQVDINIDYILLLIKKYSEGNCKDKELHSDIINSVKSSPELRSKRQLIEDFIASLNESEDVVAAWQKYVREQRDEAIDNLVNEEDLNKDATIKFLRNAFKDGKIRTSGSDINKILPKMSMFGSMDDDLETSKKAGFERNEKKQRVIEKLFSLFNKFFGIGADNL